MLFASVVLLVIPLIVASMPTFEPHDHSVKRRLAARWYHDQDHPIHSLFRRGPTGDGIQYAPVGSASWTANFPSSTLNPNDLPKPWVDALNAAVQAGKIPNIPQSTRESGQNPRYPTGVDPIGKEVCSATYKCRNPEDHWDSPDGYFASSFDDGPLPPTDTLVPFLQQNRVQTTHFMIGVNIIQYWRQFLMAWNAGGDIAVHTWTHPYMTTLSNLEVVGQLGWTMELIHNSTGGRVPRFWRPPYGDSDNRVRAIAKEVFALQTVIWNQDTEDWSLTTGGTTMDKVANDLDQWISGPKSPGLIILEHEVSNGSVSSFMNAFPKIAEHGWKFESLARLLGNGQVYQNSNDADSDVVPDDIMNGPPNTSVAVPNNPSSSSGTSSGPSSTSQSASPTPGNLAASSQTPAPNAAMSIWKQTSSLQRILTTALGASSVTVLMLWV